MVVAQLEVPLAAVLRAFEIARDAGVCTLLNPAPARPLPQELLRLTSVLTPNEEEARALAAMPDGAPADVAAQLRACGASTVVITLGAAGVFVDDGVDARFVAGRPVPNVVDTTAAGDCFTGALSVALAEGRAFVDAVRFANAAAGLSVTRAGAQPSLPTRAQVDAWLREHE